MTNTLPEKLPFTKHFSFPGASSIQVVGYGRDYNSSTYWRMYAIDKAGQKTATAPSSTSNTSTKTFTIEGDEITFSWEPKTGNWVDYVYSYVECSPLDADGNILQEYATAPVEEENTFLPSEMARAIQSLNGSTDTYMYVPIPVSTNSATLNFSQYVKDYNNIIMIYWMGARNSTSSESKDCLYVNVFPNILKQYWGDTAIASTHPILTTNYDKSTLYYHPFNASSKYFFKDDEWKNNGDLSVYYELLTTDPANFTSSDKCAYATLSGVVHLVYKKEDAE